MRPLPSVAPPKSSTRNEAAAQTQEVERRIRFRIGISLGEVIVEDGDIYGDGVNIAARLESIADVGGISISEAAASSSQDSGFVFIDLGLKHLKNITRPIRVYKVALHGETGATGRVAGASLVQGFGERPAIAVLPFRAEVGDTDHSHLADGITEDIITALSRWRTFPVIARASVYAFKDKDLELGFIGHQLGARYIGEGTLHRRGSRLRATVHLHDAETRESLFAENYDHDISDVFEMQDEIVRTIVGAIEPELLRHERERIVRAPLQDASAYELLQRGQWHHYRYTKQDNQKAQDYFRHALSVAPASARASAALALALVHAAVVGWAGDEREAYFNDAMLHSRNAVQTDPRDPLAQFTLGTTYLHTVSPEEAAGRLREATQLDPSYAAAHANLSLVYNFMNRPEAALPEIELALRLSSARSAQVPMAAVPRDQPLPERALPRGTGRCAGSIERTTGLSGGAALSARDAGPAWPHGGSRSRRAADPQAGWRTGRHGKLYAPAIRAGRGRHDRERATEVRFQVIGEQAAGDGVAGMAAARTSFRQCGRRC